MPTWFRSNNEEYRFVMFGVSHVIIIAILILGAIGIFLYRGGLKKAKWRIVEIVIAFSLIIFEEIYHYWMFINGI